MNSKSRSPSNLAAIDAVFEDRQGAWWDSLYSNRGRSVPFFVGSPDESLWNWAPGNKPGHSRFSESGSAGRGLPGALVALVLVLLGLWALQGTAMAKMVLFSAIQGRVLENGKAVAGAQIERSWRWSWKSEDGADRTSTAADGSFALPAVARSSLLGSLLPHEPLVDQIITIQHGGKAYKAWAHFKRNYDDNGEHKGRPLRITCRLESEPARRSDVFGICEFD